MVVGDFISTVVNWPSVDWHETIERETPHSPRCEVPFFMSHGNTLLFLCFLQGAALLSGGAASGQADREPAEPAGLRCRAAAAPERTWHPSRASQQDAPGDGRKGGRAARAVRWNGGSESEMETASQGSHLNAFSSTQLGVVSSGHIPWDVDMPLQVTFRNSLNMS